MENFLFATGHHCRTVEGGFRPTLCNAPAVYAVFDRHPATQVSRPRRTTRRIRVSELLLQGCARGGGKPIRVYDGCSGSGRRNAIPHNLKQG